MRRCCDRHVVTGHENVVASLGFCFFGGGLEDLRFLRTRSHGSERLLCTMPTLSAKALKRTHPIARLVKLQLPFDEHI